MMLIANIGATWTASATGYLLAIIMTNDRAGLGVGHLINWCRGISSIWLKADALAESISKSPRSKAARAGWASGQKQSQHQKSYFSHSSPLPIYRPDRAFRLIRKTRISA
jgi:hypothetical protein